MNILICYMHESELRMQSYGATNMSTWTENNQGLGRNFTTGSRVDFGTEVEDRQDLAGVRRRGTRGGAGEVGGGRSGRTEEEAARMEEEARTRLGFVGKTRSARSRSCPRCLPFWSTEKSKMPLAR